MEEGVCTEYGPAAPAEEHELMSSLGMKLIQIYFGYDKAKQFFEAIGDPHKSPPYLAIRSWRF